jgi:imidazolonepropionase-like amidohydrolase
MLKRQAMRGAHRRTLATSLVTSLVLFSPLAPSGAAAVHAQAAGGGVVAIRAGQLFDGTGENLAAGVTIIVRDGRIVEVGPRVQVPAGAEVIDLTGWTVLPGFIDMHTHLTSDPTDGFADRRFREFPGYSALLGAKNARLTLLAGFTTVRNVGAAEFADIALKSAINDGIAIGPRMFTAGKSLGITGGHCDTGGFRPDLREEPGIEQGIANGPDEVRAAVRYQVKYGADWIKTCATAGVLSAGTEIGPAQYTQAELDVMVETATMLNRRVVAHAHGNQGIRTAIRAGVASVDHGSVLDDETIRMMRERGTFLVPTMMAFEYVYEAARDGRLAPWSAIKAREVTPTARESHRKAISGGVRMAFGTDAGVFPHGTNADEFRLLVAAGMTPARALLSATREAADLLGQLHDFGTITAGRRADIIAVRGNPLQDVELLKDVGFVMKDGVVYKRDGEPVGRAR